jgi:hypothetical protein
MYSDFHFYIDLNWEDVIDRTIDVYLNKLYQLVNFAYQHRASVFYSTKHLNEFKSMVDIEGNIDEYFSASIGNKLDIILRHAKGKEIESYAFQVCFAGNNTSICHIDNVLSVVDQHPKIAILSLSNKINYFLQVRSNTDYCKIGCENPHATDEIVCWIANTEVRSFNLSSKHGENGKGNRPGESLLLCAKEDAQKLLDTAIPCFEEKEKGKNLFNFDHTHDTFIMFYYEGDNPQRQWHGFHLERDDWHKVPNFVLNYFGK